MGDILTSTGVVGVDEYFFSNTVAKNIAMVNKLRIMIYLNKKTCE